MKHILSAKHMKALSEFAYSQITHYKYTNKPSHLQWKADLHCVRDIFVNHAKEGSTSIFIQEHVLLERTDIQDYLKKQGFTVRTNSIDWSNPLA